MSAVLICPNNHGGFQGNKFCTVCGEPLIAPPVQANPASPNQQAPVAFTGVETPGNQRAPGAQTQANPHDRPAGEQAIRPPAPNPQTPAPPQPPQPFNAQPVPNYPPPNFGPPQQGGMPPGPQNFAPPQNQPYPPQNYPMPPQNFPPQGQQNFAPPNAMPSQQRNFAPPQSPPNYPPPQPPVPPQNFTPPNYPPPNFNAPPYPPPQMPPQNFVPQPPYPPMQGYPPQPMPPVVSATITGVAPTCFTCGGKGQKLSEKEIICPECKWLRPLVPGYAVDCRAFQWASDGIAMSKLRSISSLQKAARTVSDKVGRRWIETTFDAIQIGPNQLPQVYEQAVLAARILAMEHMPEIYVSGNPAWDVTTYGSDTSAFVVMGSALVMNFKADELLFLFAREMGHCRAGHTLWKTVLHFLLGAQSTRVEVKGGGILRHLNLTALVTDAVELPLLAWARHSEITADRAGMLAIGNEKIVRRVLLSWSMKSLALFDKINIESWIQQQSAAGDDTMTKVSEMISSPMPYIARRLKLMSEFADGQELKQARAIIESTLKQAAQATSEKTSAPPEPAREPEKKAPAVTGEAKTEAKPAAEAEAIKIACPTCKTTMRIPFTAFGDKDSLNVRCPNKECGKVLAVKRKTTANPAT